jgi:hypothetical protein
MFAFAATGGYMALERWTVPMTIAMTQSKPVWRTVASQPKIGVQPISADLACSVAQNAYPERRYSGFPSLMSREQFIW